MGLSQTPQALVPASIGGMTLISETVANANSSISLSSIPGTYKQLILAWNGVLHSTTGSDFALRFNNDSTANAYEAEGLRVTGTTIDLSAVQYTSLTADTGGSITVPSFGSSASLNFIRTASNGYIIIDNYASTTKYKQIQATYSYYKNATTTAYHYANCHFVWNNASAITSLDIVRLTGSATISNISNTSIKLYGVA